MKRILNILLVLLFSVAAYGQEHTYVVCAGDSVLFDLHSLNPLHTQISNVSFTDAAALDLYFPNQFQELIGENIPADFSVVYAKPNAGIFSYSYDYVDGSGAGQTFSSSVEVFIDNDCQKPLPCFNPMDAELFMPVMLKYGKIEMGDVSGDGLDDVVVGTANGFMVCINANGGFTETANVPNPDNPTSDVALHDFNSDGFLDIFLAKGVNAVGQSEIRLSNQGIDWITIGANLPNARDVLLDNQSGAQGYVDVYLSGTVNGNTERYAWDGAAYGLAESFPYQGQLNLADFDGDGDQDLLITPFFLDNFADLADGTLIGENQSTGNLNPILFVNDGNGGYVEANFFNFNEPVYVNDFNNDGLVDFVTIKNGANDVWINSPTGYNMVQSLGEYNTVDIVSADVDGDGDQDIVTCNRAGSVSRSNNIWVNNGDGTFADLPIPFGAYGSFSIATGQLFGDSGNDIFTLSVNGPSKIHIGSNPDEDGDGVCDDVDNCVTSFNPDQQDVDGNDIGDACDEGDLYPGDTNNDGVANNFDILNIGLAYSETGTPRVNASIDWEGQPSADWIDPIADAPLSFADGLNYKFADCDGNGIVDEADVIAIDQNYGSLQGKDEDESDDLEGEPPFYVSIVENAVGGTPFSYPIVLGEEDNPVDEVYGLAFTINVDLDFIVDGSLEIDFDESWLGAPNDLISVWKEIEGENKVEVGVSRKHLTASGQGGMGTMKGVFEPNIDGKDYAELETVISISNFHIIDDRADSILVDAQETIVVVSGAEAPFEENLSIDIFPNPTSDVLNISGLIENAKIEIVNLLGVTMMEKPEIQNSTSFDLSILEAGIYFVIIREGNSVQMRKIQVE